MNNQSKSIVLLSACLLLAGCISVSSHVASQSSPDSDLVGAWRGKVRFKSGALAGIKNLEFMYVFNAGGTMTESSNYDAAPPVPPAYGVWRKTGSRQFEARYEFYSTQAPASAEEFAKGGGWMPSGHGILFETISLAEDGNSYRSTIRFDAFDPADKPTETGSVAVVEAVRMSFTSK
jgi:hypothetical protein